MKVKSRGLQLSWENRRRLYGVLFTLPFTLGALIFFIYSFSQTVIYSFNDLQIAASGFTFKAVGWENYHYVLVVHESFVRTLVETIVRMLSDLPVIMAFSFFIAVILNQKFKGRTIARVLFFLPVILAADVVQRIELSDYMMTVLESSETVSILSGGGLESFLTYIRMPERMMQYVVLMVDRIPEIVRASGIQILVFLAGLQSISPQLYEAASVEGSTTWENFWLITLPMMTPLILTNIVYTVIDAFAAPYNRLPELIRNTAFQGAGFGVSAAMATVYFIVIMVILLIITAVFSRWVFYQET